MAINYLPLLNSVHPVVIIVLFVDLDDFISLVKTSKELEGYELICNAITTIANYLRNFLDIID